MSSRGPEQGQKKILYHTEYNKPYKRYKETLGSIWNGDQLKRKWVLLIPHAQALGLLAKCPCWFPLLPNLGALPVLTLHGQCDKADL